MASWPGNEQQLAAAVTASLRAAGWDIYEEVMPPGLQECLDILAKRGAVLHAIECKMTLSLELIDQAERWRGHAHRISVAVPWRAPSRTSRMKRLLLEHLGIGHLAIAGDAAAPVLRHEIAPVLSRRISPLLVDCLKNHVPVNQAGTDNETHEDAFARVCRDLSRVVAASPGIPIHEAVARIRHHYASDRSARAILRDYIARGMIPGVRLIVERKMIRLHPAEGGE